MTKCHGCELTYDGLKRSTVRNCSITSAGILRAGSKALVVRRDREVWAMLMRKGEVAAAGKGARITNQSNDLAKRNRSPNKAPPGAMPPFSTFLPAAEPLTRTS